MKSAMSTVITAVFIVIGGIAFFSDYGMASENHFDRWRSECNVDSMTDEKICKVLYAILIEEEFIMVGIAKSEEGFLITLGSGGSSGVVERCAMRVDKNEAKRSDLTYGRLCILQDSEESIFGELLRGSSVLVRVSFYLSGHLEARIPLDGFESAVSETNW